MVILKYELKKAPQIYFGLGHRLALCVIVMTPTYYSFMDGFHRRPL